jgi:hypothetical protein
VWQALRSDGEENEADSAKRAFVFKKQEALLKKLHAFLMSFNEPCRMKQ